MQQDTIYVTGNRRSGTTDLCRIVVSIKSFNVDDVSVTVGYPGLPNVTRDMETGDAVLFQTATEGIIEVRLLSIEVRERTTQFLISRVAPHLGLVAGAAHADPYNSPFTAPETERILQSVEVAKDSLVSIQTLQPEQIELLKRKLDEIAIASTRLGRRDWVNYVAGSLTSICVSAAFEPETSRRVFVSMNEAFQWLFASGVLLLQ